MGNGIGRTLYGSLTLNAISSSIAFLTDVATQFILGQSVVIRRGPYLPTLKIPWRSGR